MEEQPMSEPAGDDGGSGGHPVALDAEEQRNASPERMLFFTDGVFAIIITILVLDLKVPELDSGVALSDSLVEMRPSFIAFVLSFLLVGMYWVGHRGMFAQIRYVDSNVLWLNLLFLLPLSMVPFAASALGEYESNPTALHLYGAVLIAATLMRFVLLSYLQRHPGLSWVSSSKQANRLTTFMSVAPLAVYGAAMLVASWQPWLSVTLYLSMPLLYFGVIAFLRTDPRTRVAAGDLA
jgi:uncharacterized membrane protein